MKLTITKSLLVAVAALILGSVAHAQEVNLRAKVPFDFVLRDKMYPAGEYALQTVLANTDSLYIKNEGGAKPALLLTDPQTAPEPTKQSKLLFHRVGKTYFLYQVWVTGSSVGREFPKSHGEMELARNGANAETVTVAANISH